ncbi:MAG TPA: polysaccharide biosynthesis/export family protein [Pyrinomonadaceae bacterium]|jgi:polysaccharide export outer membrane protein
MKAIRLSILLAVLCVCASIVARAQQFGGTAAPPTPQTQASGVPVSNTSGTSGEAFDMMGALKKYKLGPGDVLDLRVFNEPQFSDRLQVTDEGNVEVPFIGAIPARCRTDVDVKKSIVEKLSKYLKNPQVSLRITEARSRPPATVFGAVRGATRVDMRRSGVRLLDVLAVAGGVTEQAGGDIQVFHTEPTMCPDTDANGADIALTPEDSVVGVFSLYQLTDLKLGKPEANPVIRPGDIVIVREAAPVYVTGAVTYPQGIYHREKLQLTRALAMVGGVRKGSNPSAIRIIRVKPNSSEQEVVMVDYDAIRKQKKPDIFLQPYDVVDVPEKSGFKESVKAFVLGQGLSGLGSGITQLPLRVLY